MDHWSLILRRQGCQATGFKPGFFPWKKKGETWGLGDEGKTQEIRENLFGTL